MGRFKSIPASELQNNQQTQQQSVQLPSDWPTIFPKPVVGLDRDGTIIEETGDYISSPDQIKIVPSSLEAIRKLRLKGYKVVILSNQGGIEKGKLTIQQVDNVNHSLMLILGQAGIHSIDGLYYSTSSLKTDEYAKPNIGMFKRAEKELPGIDFSKGWYVGDSMGDLKAANKSGAKPILVRTGHGEKTLEELESFANKDLKKITKVYNNLLEFVDSLD